MQTHLRRSLLHWGAGVLMITFGFAVTAPAA